MPAHWAKPQRRVPEGEVGGPWHPIKHRAVGKSHRRHGPSDDDTDSRKHPLSDHVEYWWVTFSNEVQPAEVTFRGGIPVHARLIGSRDIVTANLLELMERLPATPKRIFEQHQPPSTPSPRQPTSPLWLIGIILLTLVYWFSGYLFDALK